MKGMIALTDRFYYEKLKYYGILWVFNNL